MLVPRVRLPACAFVLAQNDYPLTMNDYDYVHSWLLQSNCVFCGTAALVPFSSLDSKGSWCSGITPAQHAGGPGFNPRTVHISSSQLLSIMQSVCSRTSTL